MCDGLRKETIIFNSRNRCTIYVYMYVLKYNQLSMEIKWIKDFNIIKIFYHAMQTASLISFLASLNSRFTTQALEHRRSTSTTVHSDVPGLDISCSA